jgi:hypothetical protein
MWVVLSLVRRDIVGYVERNFPSGGARGLAGDRSRDRSRDR